MKQLTARRDKPHTAVNLFLAWTDVGGYSPPSQEILSQSYGLVKLWGLDDQLCDMLEWNAFTSAPYSELVSRRLRDVKLLKESPELADRE